MVRLVALAPLLILLAAACGGTGATPTPPLPDKGEGVVQGRVSIGPLCPVEPCGNDVPNPYAGRSVVLSSENLGPVDVPLAADGTFEVLLPEGEYTIDLTDCAFLGCSHTLPVPARVVAGETTTLSIDIDTGIR